MSFKQIGWLTADITSATGDKSSMFWPFSLFFIILKLPFRDETTKVH